MGQSFPLSLLNEIELKSVGGRCRCPGRTRLLLRLEDHRNIPGTRACRERSTLDGRASTLSPGKPNQSPSFLASLLALSKALRTRWVLVKACTKENGSQVKDEKKRKRKKE
ncbi:L(+)-tartrate dehydratase subunit alpha [Striga asiatica]|uniref:L(+)-tartrate dehydratase subunit alpha n=1 Tax=Striga asiatica TaxID=4170 RepID=A0A5A7QMU4_STRAF|nr:L(+)-tartrate dehydratase subunit alpha [Striga asiatica]